MFKKLLILLAVVIAASHTPEAAAQEGARGEGGGERRVGESQAALIPKAHCFCKLSCANLSGQKNATMVIDGWVGPKTYGAPIGPKKRNECASWCNGQSNSYIGSQTVATKACAIGCPDGSTIKAFSAIGTGPYQPDNTIGTLTNTPAVTATVYDCNGKPGTWLDNPTPGNGYHARCVKNSCNSVSGVPAAPSWVSIGTAWASATGAAWVTDDKGDIWYGVPAHATTTVTSGPQCHF